MTRIPTQGAAMRSEKDKMLAGELYDPLDPELVRARERARDLCQDLNATRERDQEARRRLLQELFGRGGGSVWMQPPIFAAGIDMSLHVVGRLLGREVAGKTARQMEYPWEPKP